jgi:hypothetical protein
LNKSEDDLITLSKDSTAEKKADLNHKLKQTTHSIKLMEARKKELLAKNSVMDVKSKGTDLDLKKLAKLPTKLRNR